MTIKPTNTPVDPDFRRPVLDFGPLPPVDDDRTSIQALLAKPMYKTPYIRENEELLTVGFPAILPLG